MDKDQLLQRLENETKVFQNIKIKEAFTDIDRADFVDEDYKVEAYEDYSLPIGYGQNILQPTLTAFMLELAELREGESVLLIGAGSGYMTALIAHIVGDEGSVCAIEVVPELITKAKHNLAKYQFPHVRVLNISEKSSLVDEGVFDKVIITADTEEIPDEILGMLKVEGIIILPVLGVLCKVRKMEDSIGEEGKYDGFSFEPYISM